MGYDLQQINLLIGIFQGTDAKNNDTIGIFNTWIFDSKKILGKRLCQEGLGYCDSTKHVKSAFVKFQNVLFFQDVTNER